MAISRELLDQADTQGFRENGKRRSSIWLPRLGKHWLMKAPSKGRLVDDMGASNSAGMFSCSSLDSTDPSRSSTTCRAGVGRQGGRRRRRVYRTTPARTDAYSRQPREAPRRTREESTEKCTRRERVWRAQGTKGASKEMGYGASLQETGAACKTVVDIGKVPPT